MVASFILIGEMFKAFQVNSYYSPVLEVLDSETNEGMIIYY